MSPPSEFLTVLERLAFKAQKFWGHVTLAAPFRKMFKASCGNMHIKFEVRSFNRFKLV